MVDPAHHHRHRSPWNNFASERAPVRHMLSTAVSRQLPPEMEVARQSIRLLSSPTTTSPTFRPRHSEHTSPSPLLHPSSPRVHRMADVHLDADVFHRRARRLLAFWKVHNTPTSIRLRDHWRSLSFGVRVIDVLTDLRRRIRRMRRCFRASARFSSW
jgi:hypothetical protein